MAVRVLAVDDNPVNLKVVAATLNHAGYEVITASNGVEALTRISESHPDLIVMDVMMPEMDGYEVCRRLRSDPVLARLPVILLTAQDSLEGKIKGFEAGADEYVVKPFHPAELQARIKGLLRRVEQTPSVRPAEAAGKVFSVISMKGGVGVTTIATNLAVGLAQIWTKPVALADMVLTMGQSALMLNLPLRNTWSNLTPIATEDIESEMVERVLIPHPSGVSMLAAPRKPDQNEVSDGNKVKAVIGILKKRFPYIVLDLPRDFNDTTLAGLDASTYIVAVMAPELASIRAMSGMLELFDNLQYPRERIILVLNWTFERRGLARKDIENALKQNVSLVIPFAPETFVTAINFGTPPVLTAPTSPIGILFEDFAYLLSSEEHKKQKPVAPSEAWQRVIERARQRPPVTSIVLGKRGK
jgi:pilus assembly protein CpaE